MDPRPSYDLNRRSVFIVAEAGSNWRVGSKARDLAMCRRLIEVAASADVNAVKFQLFRAKTIYALGSGPCDHLMQKGIQEDIGRVFEDLELPDDFLPDLAQWCREAGVELIISAFSERDFRAVDPFVRYHKIASPELHHPGLLQLAANSGKPVFLSTGISTLEEIEWALSFFPPERRQEVVLLQCTVEYPTSPAAMNLATLPVLAKRFGCLTGLSDHSLNPLVAPVAATALGARVIEKHFTLHRSLVGPDHSWAITGEELRQMVRAVRTCETMLGDTAKEIQPAELPLRRFSRRSLQLLMDVRKGELLQLNVNYGVLRPGTREQGIHPCFLPQVEGARATRDLKAGMGIQRGDWSSDA
jgi:sialic acid synthase SpsE